MRLLVLLGTLVIVLGLTGCGNARRHAVVKYIDSVNAIQRDMRLPLARVEYSYRQFVRPGASQKTGSAPLWSAVRSLTQLHDRLVRLQAPKEAAVMAHDLARLTALEAAFAREVALFADYVPRYRRVLAPLGAAGKAFRTSLRRARGPGAQVVALRAYRKVVAPIVAGLDRLRPPPVLVPLHRQQIDSLRRVGAAAGRLSTALERQDTARIGPLLSEFENASQSASSLGAQRAQIAAERAYNRRLYAIRALAAQIERERLALNNRLG